jgi:hypothetical protein
MEDSLVAIVAAVVAVAAVGVIVTIRFTKKSRIRTTQESQSVEQHHNVVGGDQAGRDIIKK